MKKNIAILAGGYSSEYHISILSAEQTASQIDTNKYNVFIINIQKESWIVNSEEFKGVCIDKNDFSFTANNIIYKFHCVIPIIHGTPGENGLIQGYFDMLRIPYTGSGLLASTLTFNKFYCNTYLKNFNIPISDSVLVRNNETINESIISSEIGYPCFVKPNSGGSSFGITKVKKSEDLVAAIYTAFKESDEVIIEKAVTGREISCGLLEYKGEITILPLAEIISKNEYFDYAAKYNSELNQEIVPALIPEELNELCIEQSTKICKLLNCKGISRIDYILSGNKFYFIEINSIPGMTKESIVPKMLRTANLSLTSILSNAIEEAVSNVITF